MQYMCISQLLEFEKGDSMHAKFYNVFTQIITLLFNDARYVCDSLYILSLNECVMSVC